MKIGKTQLDVRHHGYIMGILNVTPDSFSDGGQYNQLDQGLHRVEEMIHDGASIIDIGGESTRPGHTRISDDEEIHRVTPMIEAITKRFDVPISLDTYKTPVAQAGIQAGADMINDIWGLRYDHKMAELIAKENVVACLMHNREDPSYENFVDDVVRDLEESINLGLHDGMSIQKMMIDPGIGFAKTLDENLLLMKHMDRLQLLGCPVLLGTSRKSMIGQTLQLPTDQRIEGTVATTVYGYMKGCRIFRVHDVKENYQALQMVEAMEGH